MADLCRQSKRTLCALWRQRMTEAGRRQIYGKPPEYWRKEEIAFEIAELEQELAGRGAA